MIKCVVCRTENLDNSRFCDECGAILDSDTEPLENSARVEHEVTDDYPAFRSGATIVSGTRPITPGKKELGGIESSNGVPPAKLEIERGATAGTTFHLSTNESQIGRWDADNGIFPDIDLDSHDPEAKVSRRHARIFVEDGNYLIEDLGSTNGTFINRGRRLIPGDRHRLSDGDELIVGKTFLRFHII